MSNLGLASRVWQIADDKVQRAIEGLANTYDNALKTLNKAFDFTDSVTTARTALNVLGSLSSASGFKSVVGPWQRSQAAFATTATILAWGADSNATGATALTQGFYPTHPGSVIGMQLAGQASAATTVTATVYKNGVATAATVPANVSAGTSFATATFAKGSVAFAAGDRLDVYYTASAANTGQLVSSFTVEMVA